MKNTKIEKILRGWKEGKTEAGLSSAVCNWCRFYEDSKEKGFDEIVIYNECIFESEVGELLEAAKELKIEYFVFASGFSGSFEVINEMVKNGARVGKFVVKEYKEKPSTKDEIGKIPGIRINL